MIDRLLKLLEFLEVTPSEFADQIEVQRSSISHIFSGRNKPSLDFVMKIKQTYPNINTDWLIFGTDEMIISEKKIEHIEENNSLEEVKEKYEVTPTLFQDLEITKQKEVVTEEYNSNIEIEAKHIDNHPKKEIEKIILFYKDGTFTVYEN